MMTLRTLSLALLSLAIVTAGAFATGDSCTDASGYQYSLLSMEVQGSYYVYRYLVTAGTKTTGLSHWNIFLPDSCGVTPSGTCALGGLYNTKEAECDNPINTNAMQCNTRSWKIGTSADIMTFKIHKNRVVHPTGGIVTVQSKSGKQSGSTCSTCQLKGPQCATASDVNVNESESTFYRWIRSLTVGTKDVKEKDKKDSTKEMREKDTKESSKEAKVEEKKESTKDVKVEDKKDSTKDVKVEDKKDSTKEVKAEDKKDNTKDVKVEDKKDSTKDVKVEGLKEPKVEDTSTNETKMEEKKENMKVEVNKESSKEAKVEDNKENTKDGKVDDNKDSTKGVKVEDKEGSNDVKVKDPKESPQDGKVEDKKDSTKDVKVEFNKESSKEAKMEDERESTISMKVEVNKESSKEAKLEDHKENTNDGKVEDNNESSKEAKMKEKDESTSNKEENDKDNTKEMEAEVNKKRNKDDETDDSNEESTKDGRKNEKQERTNDDKEKVEAKQTYADNGYNKDSSTHENISDKDDTAEVGADDDYTTEIGEDNDHITPVGEDNDQNENSDGNKDKDKTEGSSGLRGKVVNCSKTSHRLGSPGGRGKRPSWMKIRGDSLMYRDHDGPFPYKGDYKGYESRHFESYRFGKKGFQYVYEQPCYNDDHVYIVTMGFAETHDKSPNYCLDGARVFSIEVNGESFASDLDVYKSSGGCKTAYAMSQDFKPKDGKFEFDFIPKMGSPMISFIDVRIKDRRNLGIGCRGNDEVQIL